ncbi:snaclec rhodocytin subunit alpha-like [Clarias gariepinus]|uniref:snaclec rhodocytin subunit alpha-like n=1 Tax=Clarias gariepinus TaxID=13013 RepID=UPI00234CAD4D|nr:snaclec rhodocytin subunit alpha-like [Clarias gariepinus]
MQENNQILQSGSGSADSWIGLNRSFGIWGWSDGEHISILNWKSGFPIYGDATYGYNCCSISFQYQGFWVNHYCRDQRNFYCYQYLILVQEKKTFDEAQEYCRTNYTGLASVTSWMSLQQLNLETSKTQTENVWIGLRFLNGKWLWMSQEAQGSLVSMPSCPPLSSRCGSLHTTTNTLENRNCNDRLNFVCYWT